MVSEADTMRMMAAAAVLALVACDKRGNWGDLEAHVRPACQQFYRSITLNTRSGGSRKEWDAGSLGETVFVAECAKLIAPSIKPCAAEFAAGTDTALQCVARRSQPALAFALWEICARHAKPDENLNECEENAATASGDAARLKAFYEKHPQTADALAGDDNIDSRNAVGTDSNGGTGKTASRERKAIKLVQGHDGNRLEEHLRQLHGQLSQTYDVRLVTADDEPPARLTLSVGAKEVTLAFSGTRYDPRPIDPAKLDLSGLAALLKEIKLNLPDQQAIELQTEDAVRSDVLVKIIAMCIDSGLPAVSVSAAPSAPKDGRR
jgi:hypothetical protein